MRASSDFTPYIKRKNVEGVEFDFLIANAQGRSWYDVDSTDPDWPEMRFLRDHLVSPGDVILECGGHHGCTTILLSRWVGPGGRVITFEPHPRNAAILRRNLELNGISNVTLRQNAVGAEHHKVAMTDASNSAVRPRRWFLNRIEAQVVKLDDFANEKPTLLKIDVEGFEVAVLQGAREVLKTRPKLAIEIHADLLPRYGKSVEELIKCVDFAGYEMWIQWDYRSSPVPYDERLPINSRVHLFAIPVASSA